ncbi:MAG: hypothetical protein IJZ89_06495 [Clostridia bacterium]|nr:hypothetical protein [Clostridia bacterium]
MKKKKNRSAAVTDIVPATEKKKPNLRILALLVINTAIVFGFYRFMLNYPYFEIVLISYMVIFAVLLLGYIIYNRGFSRNGITVDMLPDSMTEEEKTAFVEDAQMRKRKSKWMLTLIFPFVFTFGFDALSWFITDNILSMFKG